MQKLKPFAQAELIEKKLDADAFSASTDEDVFEHADAVQTIKIILDDFKTRGWLSDARFTEQLVHARKSKFGSARVANELREKGVSDDLITQALDTFKASEFDNALAICRKKYHEVPKSREDWARQARFLQSRGFGFDIIKKVLNTKQDVDD